MKLLYVAERPSYKDPKGYIGAHGRLLDRMLAQAGISRDDVTLVWADCLHNAGYDWRGYDCVVAAGDAGARAVLGWDAPVSLYHGSVLPLGAAEPNSWAAYLSWLQNPKVIITWDMEQLHKSWEDHPLATRDWQKAGQIARGTYKVPSVDTREWIVDQPHRLQELLNEPVVVFDTELTPMWMIGFASATQVHVCHWSQACEGPTQDVLQSPNIIKVAHNLQHDLAMCDLRFGFEVKRPYFDTYGGMHLLNTALERSLSPGVAARFTNWPYHKWLNDVDSTHYNGLDNVVCFDGYVEIMRQLEQRGLVGVAEHDHDLLEVLYDMQKTGFRVSEVARAEYAKETAEELAYAEDALMSQAEPIIRAKVGHFVKPHLFVNDRRCSCCGGGKVSAQHCWRCGGLPKKPKSKADYKKPCTCHQLPEEYDCFACTQPGTSSTVAELKAALPPCSLCQATGKVAKWERFNPGSDDAVADVLYRGLGISPRKYKGKETTKAEQLKPLGAKYPFVKALVEASVMRADLSTVERLTPGTDSKLHCVFDPWGTESGRVASKEGLLLPGTNAMNVPKKARKFVIPDDGYLFLYPDMEQIEARAVAVLSNDPGFKKAFTELIDWPGNERHGTVDSHTKVVQLMLAASGILITRDQSKRLTYAAMYGVSAKQLAVELTAEAMRKGGGIVTEQQAELMLVAFFKTFPYVKRWHEAVEQELLRKRTVRSPSGRERHWPGRIVDNKTKGITREILKQGWSFVPQEMGAHVLAKGLIEIYRNHRSLLTPLIHVHDAGLFQAKIEQIEEAKQTAEAALSRTCFGMWFPCKMKVGGNWFEAS